jgi:hypothetical protein
MNLAHFLLIILEDAIDNAEILRFGVWLMMRERNEIKKNFSESVHLL